MQHELSEVLRDALVRSTPTGYASLEDMRAAFVAHTTGQEKFTRRMAIAIGDQFGMKPLDVVRHYQSVGLLKPGSVEWFRANGGFTKEHYAEARADRAAGV